MAGARRCAHFPSKCAEKLNWFSVDHMETMKWKSDQTKSAAREFLITPDMGRLKTWVANIDAYQVQLAKGMLPVFKDLLKCIADNAGPQRSALSAPTQPADRHVVPVCGEQMARRNFKGRFCPSPWVEIWAAAYVGKYRQVWRCKDRNTQYGTLMAGKYPTCVSAWLPKGYSVVK